MYLGLPCNGYIWYKLSSCLFDNTRDKSAMYEKAKFICFIYMQMRKVKFKSVQINMKQVSYSVWDKGLTYPGILVVV